MPTGPTKRWTEQEVEFINKNYQYSDKVILMTALPNRTWNAIILKALSFGLKRFNGNEDVNKYCGRCKQIKDISQFTSKIKIGKSNKPYTCRDCYNQVGRERYSQNREEEVERNRLKYQKLREDVFSHYGNICACCAETEFDFLTIDHITMTRKEHKKMTGGNAGGVYLYYWLKRNHYPSGFQTLCMNCNSSKYKNDGKCIHQLKRALINV